MPRDGTATIISLVRKICKLRAVWGAASLPLRTTPGFAAAVDVLAAECAIFEALDDQPGEIDNTAPLRVGEDGPPL